MINIAVFAANFTKGLPITLAVLYDGIGQSFASFYGAIIAVFYIYYFMQLRAGSSKLDLTNLCMITIGIPFALSIATNSTFFINTIYKPLDHFITKMPQFILSLISNEGSNVFDEFHNMTVKINNLSDKITADTETSIIGFKLTSWKITILAWIIEFIFFILSLYIAYLFILGNIAGIVLFCTAPITIPLAVFPESRKYFKAMIKGYFHYNLPPIFATLIVAITINVIKLKIGSEVDALLNSNEPPHNLVELLFSILGYSLITLFLIKRSYELSDAILSGSTSQGFQGAATMLATATGSFLGTSAGKILGGLAQKSKGTISNISTEMAKEFGNNHSFIIKK
ncbi:MAG: type IV secretion system protein [Sphingobacteriia bacterium]|nr:type IV secretion system protein [Sphingobacteriia bacterium]